MTASNAQSSTPAVDSILAALAADQNGARETIEQMASAARGGAQEVGSEEAATESGQHPRTETDEIEVEWEPGVRRKAKVSDLVEAAKKRAEAEEMSRSAQRLLAQGGIGQLVAQRYAEMTPDQQAFLKAFLDNPQVAQRNGRQPARQAAPDDDPFAILDGGNHSTRNGSSGGTDELAHELQELKNLSLAQAQALAAIMHERAQGQASSHVDELMQSFPGAFDTHREWWKGQILTAMAADPNAAAEQVVTKMAAAAQKFQARSEGVLPSPSGAVRGSVTTTPKAPGFKPGQLGKQMESGTLWKTVSETLGLP